MIILAVDDCLIASDDFNGIESVVSCLKDHFEVKVFEAKCFLCLQIVHLTNDSIGVHQEAYVNKILNRFNMLECKAVCTSADCNQNLGDFVNEEKNIFFHTARQLEV